jgi:hypothetical protein
MSTFNPFSGNTYTLGSSISSTDTTILLSSFTVPVTGTLVTMALLNTDIVYGTIAPKTTQSEFISFTGITQNSNGTATLTGVTRGLAKTDPFTSSASYKLPHSGQSQFIISDAPQVFKKYVSLENNETITGTKTFPAGGNANAPVSGTIYSAPTNDLEYASKKYIDDIAISGSPNATTTVKGIIELATQAEVDARTATGGTGASLVATPTLARSTLLSDYVIDTGSATAYAIAPTPAITAYVTGQRFLFKATHANTTTTPTLAVNGLTAKTIVKPTATALNVGDIPLNGMIEVVYDGTNFEIVSASNLPLPPLSSSNINQVVMTTDGTSYAFGVPYNYQSFTASGTWTKPTNLSGTEMVVVQLWGAGGGGGSCKNASGGSGGGGGGGAFVEARFRASDLSATETVTIGAGGIAGVGATPTAGGVGGNTTFGSRLTAYGGGGGGYYSSGSAAGGGGGGGGAQSAGSVGGNDQAANGGGAGGSPVGGAASVQSAFGGAGGGNVGNSGAAAFYGGAGGGAGGTSASGGAGGAGWYGGGAGGGGKGGTGSAGAGGAASVTGYGGAGGAGSAQATATDGSAPAGGGGGAGTNGSSTTQNGGAGARGEARVWVIY